MKFCTTQLHSTWDLQQLTPFAPDIQSSALSQINDPESPKAGDLQSGQQPNAISQYGTSQVALVVKNLLKRLKGLEFDPWVRKSPWRRVWQLTPVFLPGESYGQRSLAGYGPQGHRVRQLEQLSTHTRACHNTSFILLTI